MVERSELRPIELHLDADIVLRHPLALLQIGARAERLRPAPGDHDGAHRRVRRGFACELPEREKRRARETVHPSFAVDRPDDDMATLLDLDRKRLVRHGDRLAQVGLGPERRLAVREFRVVDRGLGQRRDRQVRRDGEIEEIRRNERIRVT